MLKITLSFAQEKCKFQAMVTDSLNLPIHDASIVAYNTENKSQGYAFSDKKGEFTLELPCNQSYELEIEHMNYKSKVYTVKMDKSKRETIVLKPNTVNLKEIIAKGRVPVIVKGDTIEYDAQSFKTGAEDNLEDILKKLPGIEVEKGKVYYQGKEMKSIKVEGREIFGGNQKLVTKNLPSEAVSKIQLNKKFKANPFANSLQQDDEFELNIVLEEDKKNLIFGNATLGGDAHKHTDVQKKLFYFSEKTDATLIGDYNTYGKQVFTPEDYFHFLGGMSELTDESGSYSLRNAMKSVEFNADNNASIVKNFIAATNVGYQPTPNLYISGFALGTKNAVRYSATHKQIYSDFTQKDKNENDQEIFALISRINVEYAPANKAQVKYRVNINHQNANDRIGVTTFINNEERASIFRNSYKQRKNATIYQKLSAIKKINQDDNIGFYLSHIYQKEHPDLVLTSSESPFSSLFNLSQRDNKYHLNHHKDLRSNSFQFLSVYNHLLTNASNIRIKAGVNLTLQNLHNSLKNFNQSLNSTLVIKNSEYKYQEYYMEATYTRKFKELKADLGLTMSYFNAQNTPENHTEKHLKQTHFLPHLQLKYKVGQNGNLYAGYNTSIEVPNINDWLPGIEVQNYYSIFRGNPKLGLAKTQHASLSYYYYNFFQFINFGIALYYKRMSHTIKTQGYFNGKEQTTSLFNATMPDAIWGGDFNLGKRFSKIYEIKTNAGFNKSAYESRSNNQSYRTRVFTHHYLIENILKWRKTAEIKLGVSANVNNYEAYKNSNHFINFIPYTESAFMLSDKVLLQAKYQYNKQWQNGKFINDYQGLEASLRVKPAQKTYVKLIAGNLLNSNQWVSNGFNDFYTYVYTKETIGRYFILQVRYKF